LISGLQEVISYLFPAGLVYLCLFVRQPGVFERQLSGLINARDGARRQRRHPQRSILPQAEIDN
jgi:hypothetical protein